MKGGIIMTIVKWRPFRDMVNFQEEMNRMFDRFYSHDSWDDQEELSRSTWHPAMDISENKDEFVISAELPGLVKKDIQITFTNGTLKIEGERKKDTEEKDVNYHRVERTYGKFCRTFQLPTIVQQDKISADFKEGILNIRLPKAEEVKPKEIEVKIS